MHYEGTYLGTMKPAPKGTLSSGSHSRHVLFQAWTRAFENAELRLRGKAGACLSPTDTDRVTCQGEFQNDLKHGFLRHVV